MISERKFSKQAELDFMHNFRHETEGDRWAKHEIESLRQQVAAKQAEVDALMLEYCPSEMSQEQLDNWAAHQRPSEWEQLG